MCFVHACSCAHYHNPTSYPPKYKEACKNLQIKEDSSQIEAKMAYRKLSKRYHPDLIQDERKKAAANKMMKQLNESREVVEKYHNLPIIKKETNSARETPRTGGPNKEAAVNFDRTHMHGGCSMQKADIIVGQARTFSYFNIAINTMECVWVQQKRTTNSEPKNVSRTPKGNS